MKRFILTLTIGSIFLILISNISSLANEGNAEAFTTVRFAVIGDRTGGATPGIYEQIVMEIERMKPDFVITVGDMIEGPENNEERIRNKWEEYLSIVAPLSMAIYYTPGNNDIETDFMESIYLEYIGRPYYSFNEGNIHFIILDNSRWESSDELPKEQLDWLIKDLKNSKGARHTIVFYHKPFWEISIVEGKPDTLHTLFRNFGVDALFSGHYHTYFSGKYDDILYTNVGSSGGSISRPSATGLKYHFVWVTVDSSEISIAPIKMGAVLPWDEITADENNFVYSVQTNCISFDKPFLIEENNDFGESPFEVTVKNFSQKFILEDTIRWDIPAGWSVEPSSKPVSIAADSAETYIFNIKNEKTPYPSPKLSVNFPYGAGKTAQAVKELPTARQTACYKTNRKPKIDGNITEKIWQNPITNLYGYDGLSTKTDSVQFYFAYDDEYLYLASLCKESDIESITAEIKEHDGAVYGEDCVGYILQPDPDVDKMYLVYVNPFGFVYDQEIMRNTGGYFEGDPSWNCAYKVKTKIDDDFWSVELRIPFSQFGITVEKNNIWGLNMRRKQPRLNDAAHWQIPWRYGPEYLGRLILQ